MVTNFQHMSSFTVDEKEDESVNLKRFYENDSNNNVK